MCDKLNVHMEKMGERSQTKNTKTLKISILGI